MEGREGGEFTVRVRGEMAFFFPVLDWLFIGLIGEWGSEWEQAKSESFGQRVMEAQAVPAGCSSAAAVQAADCTQG